MADALDQLTALRTFESPDRESVIRLQARIVERRRRRRRHRLVAGSLTVAVAAALILPGPGDDGHDLQTVDAPPTTVPSTTDDSVAVLPDGSVISSELGIETVVGGEPSRLSDEPTAVAFSVGGGAIVAQGAETGDVNPAWPTGPVLVLEDGATRELVAEPGGEVRLHDAGLVDGRAVAVVTARTGSNPDDTDERLLLVDLETGERTDLGSIGGWEAGLTHAQLAGSRIVTIVSGEARFFLVVRRLDGAIEWEAPDSVHDAAVSVAVTGDRVLRLQPRFEGAAFEPQLVIDHFDLTSGAPLSSDTISLRPNRGLEIEAGFCSFAESSAQGLVCDRTGAGPIEIDLESGATAPVASVDRGRATLPRAPGAVTPPPEAEPAADEPCAGLDGTEPVVGGTALTSVPPGFVRDGDVVETSTGFIDMDGESHATLRFSDSDGRWIEFDSFGVESPGAYVEQLHAGAVTQRVTYLRCVNPADAQPTEHQATLSNHPDRTILAAQEWEYGGFALAGSPDVTAEELLTVASGLMHAPP